MLVSKFPTVTFFGDAETTDVTVDLSQAGNDIAKLASYFDSQLKGRRSVGIIIRSSPELLLSWIALLSIGCEPLILQFPTKKQSVADWSKSIANTMAVADIGAVVVGPGVLVDALAVPAIPISAELFATFPSAETPVTEIPNGSVLQLSSGTTGHRKAVRFTLDQIERHVEDYSAVLLKGDDVIVSWLPLYHDMGFVACWLVPLLTGARLAMCDPMDWSARPTILFDAVKRYGGTICYLPNFAFEVMARHAGHGPFPSMRSWISCSEPVYEASIRRFIEATDTSPNAVSACYAMAENVFAVTQSDGLTIAEVAGERRVACGRPIPNCDIEIRDGQIWARSRASISGYVGTPPIVDERGFYPTGDLGVITDVGLVVTGRVHDLVNVAGRKYLLNDLDRALEAAVPGARGRIVTCVNRSQELGTEQPVFFAEDPDFFSRADAWEIREALVQETGIENLAFHFVPPLFITKTSSGKANRRATMQNWLDAQAWRREVSPAGSGRSLGEDVAEAFGGLPTDRPIASIMDSLGRVTLSVIARGHRLDVDPRETIDELLARADRPRAEAGQQEGISIVALCDSNMLAGVSEALLAEWSELVGCPVSLEHVCLPASEVLLDELIFHDYFLPRGDSDDFDAVKFALGTVRRASMLIVDDIAEIAFPMAQTYPQLDRQFRRAEDADLLAFRWQQYTRRHHKLPIAIRYGCELNDDRNASLAKLGDYLGVPIIRVATLSAFQETTDGWEVVERVNATHTTSLKAPASLPARIRSTLLAGGAVRRQGGDVSRLDKRDLAHFCCWALDPAKIDEVLSRHERFCILGAVSSVPYIAKRARELGKQYFHHGSIDVASVEQQFDAIMMTGAWGKPKTAKPIYALFHAGFVDPNLRSDHFLVPLVAESRFRVADIERAANARKGAPASAATVRAAAAAARRS